MDPRLIEVKGRMQLRSCRVLSLNYTIPVDRIINFWEGIRKGKMVTTKCRKCGELFFPPTMDCAKCFASDMEWVELSGDAELETFTFIIVSPASFSKYGPYICAIGRLKEGVKVLAWLTGIKREDVKVGMKMKLLPKVDDEGKFTYEFVPVL